MIYKILRDNSVINLLVRNCLRLLYKWFGVFGNLTNKYRIFGVVHQQVNKIHFKMYAEADDFIANDLYYNKEYELGEFRLLKQLLPTCNTFVDVGANTGIFTIYAAIYNKNLKVVSFEPHPSNYKRLCKNVTLNKLSNVFTKPYAVGNSKDVIKFTVPDDLRISATSSANASFTKNFHKIDFKDIMVKQVVLDQSLSGVTFTSRDLFKIDVEYYELEVLKGASTILRDQRPMIMLEILDYHSLIIQFPQMENMIDKNLGNDIIAFLTSLDYYRYAIHKDKVKFIEAPDQPANRNFLFMPYKLKGTCVDFDMILHQDSIHGD